MFCKVAIFCYLKSNPILGCLPLLTDNAMSGGLEVLALREDDVTKFLAAEAHLGTRNCDFQMEQYVYKRKNDGKRGKCHLWKSGG